jgi:hypothetical protein
VQAGRHTTPASSSKPKNAGLANVLDLEFEPASQMLSSVLTYCDMTTSPAGELATAERRLAERQQRYGPGHLVSRQSGAPRR